ncbi:hypothetical protein ACFSJY_16465 [Thalassotalea euphylliae]|uniref:hypothetical protein n=1 Tax=Thalassotalea euphylliae TaxID=1655234 RepID=UPI003637A184
MLQIALASFLVWCFFRVKEKDSDFDGFSSLTLVLAPAILVFISGIAIEMFELSDTIKGLTSVFYIVIPFIVLKLMDVFSTKKSLIYSFVVFGLVMLSTLPFAVLGQIEA